MSRSSNNPSSNTWHASDPYFMRFAAASFGPWATGAPPGLPTMPPHHHQTHSTHPHASSHVRTNNPVDTINPHHSAAAAAAHHSAHAAAMWSQSPGPFGVLPHQENAPANGPASYTFSKASALHHRHHHQGQSSSAETYALAAYMNPGDASNYSRYMNMGMNMLTAAAARSNSGSSTSRLQHQQQVHPHHHHHHHHHPQYPSFPGSADRIARDIMSASAASYSSSVQQSPAPSGVVDPCAASGTAVIIPPWYPTLPRMSESVMNSPRMSTSNHPHHSVHNHHANQRSNSSAAVSSNGNSSVHPGSGFTGWPSYPTSTGHTHGQVVSASSHQMHQSSAKYSTMPSIAAATAATTPYHGINGTSNTNHGSNGPSNHANNVSRTTLPSVNCPSAGNNFNNYLSMQCGNMPIIGPINSSAAPSLPSMNHLNANHGSLVSNVMNTNGNNSNNSNNYANVTESHVMTSTPVASNNNSNASSGSGSRSSSVASNHGVQVANSTASSNGGQGDTSNSCSYTNYNSPSANSVHAYSPYPRTNTGGPSHTPKPVNQGNDNSISGYSSTGGGASMYNNSNGGQSGPNGGYGAMQTTSRVSPPSSGYPTPPASVTMVSNGASNGAGQGVVTPGDDSSHGMHSHFPLTPQSSSSYYSSSSGYSSSSKCSTDSVISGSSTASNNSNSNSNNGNSNSNNTSNSNTSCMVAAAAAAAAAAANYVNHMPSVSTGESTGISDASSTQSSQQSSSMVTSACGRTPDHHHIKNNPGPVSISDGQADPNLVSVYTEQEIDFPCISYSAEEGQNFATYTSGTNSTGHPSASINGVKINGGIDQCTVSGTYKKRKDKTRKKEKKEKVKQLAAADRLAPVADRMLSSTFAGAFDVAPIIPSPMVSQFELHNSMQFSTSQPLEQVSNGINPYVLGIDHSHVPLMLSAANGANMNGPGETADASSCFANEPVNHHMGNIATLPPNQSSQHQQNQQANENNLLSHHQSIVQTTDIQSQQVTMNGNTVEKDSLADLEENLRLLTEGASSCSDGNGSVSSSHVNPNISTNELPDIQLSDFNGNTESTNQLHHSHHQHFAPADASTDSNILANVSSLDHTNGVSPDSNDISSAVVNMQGVKIDPDDLIKFMQSTNSDAPLQCSQSQQQQQQQQPQPQLAQQLQDTTMAIDTSVIGASNTYINQQPHTPEVKKVKKKRKKATSPSKEKVFPHKSVKNTSNCSTTNNSPLFSSSQKVTHPSAQETQIYNNHCSQRVNIAPSVKLDETQSNCRVSKNNTNLLQVSGNSVDHKGSTFSNVVNEGSKSKGSLTTAKGAGHKSSSKKRKSHEIGKVYDEYEFSESPYEPTTKKAKSKSSHNHHASNMQVNHSSASQQTAASKSSKKVDHTSNGPNGQSSSFNSTCTSSSLSNSSSLLESTPLTKGTSQNLINKSLQGKDQNSSSSGSSNHGTSRSDQRSQNKSNSTNDHGSILLNNCIGKVSTATSRSTLNKVNSKQQDSPLVPLNNVTSNAKSSKSSCKTSTAQENSCIGKSVISKESNKLHSTPCKLQPLKPNDNHSSLATSQSKSVKANNLQSHNHQPPPQPLHNAPQISPDNKKENSTTSTTSAKVNSTGNAPLPAAISVTGSTSSSRRRSQDKKTLTVREGLMRTSDFVVSMDEMNLELPMIWRIEGKSLLQRFEPTQQDGITVYTNTNSYSAWNPTVKQRYRGVDVRIMGQTRKVMIVEKLGLTKSSPSNVNINGNSSSSDKFNKSNDQCEVSSNDQYQAPFEVFLQTLISQTLDPNFIAEIVKEKDDYFLSKVQMIEEICSRKKARFFSRVKWDASIVKCIETFPVVEVTSQKNENDLRCRLCHDAWSSQMFSFSGPAYDLQTLEEKESNDSVKQTKYASCDSCKDRVKLFSRLHHYKYNFYLKCQEKVEEMRSGDSDKESHVILAQCLDDQDWMELMFKKMDKIWCQCDQSE